MAARAVACCFAAKTVCTTLVDPAKRTGHLAGLLREQRRFSATLPNADQIGGYIGPFPVGNLRARFAPLRLAQTTIEGQDQLIPDFLAERAGPTLGARVGRRQPSPPSRVAFRSVRPPRGLDGPRRVGGRGIEASLVGLAGLDRTSHFVIDFQDHPLGPVLAVRRFVLSLNDWERVHDISHVIPLDFV